MKIITPDYYQNFKCIKGECKHSCCIGWEIDIDDKTLEKYNNFKGDFSEKLKENIVVGDSAYFKLDKDERCPFLNDKGLCDIIINSGEDMLCQICRDHPRFRNFYDDFVEIGLGLACEAAAKIILSKSEKVTLNLTDEMQQIPVINFREKLFCALQNRDLPIDERVDNVLKMVGADFPCDKDWYSVFNGLEKMDKTWEGYLPRIQDGLKTDADGQSLDTAYEQLLVYLIFRHFTDCEYDGRYKERVLFAALIYKVIKTMNISNTLGELIEIARAFSCEIEYSDENIDILLNVF